MILNETLDVRAVLQMNGGAGKWFQMTPKTTAERNLMIVGWGITQRGRMWYNTDDNQLEGWNGSAVVLLG